MNTESGLRDDDGYGYDLLLLVLLLAAAAINVWSGVPTMLPLLMACMADAYLEWYRTIVLASLLFVVVSSSFSGSLHFPLSPLPRMPGSLLFIDVSHKKCVHLGWARGFRLTRFASLQSMGMLTVSALPAFHHDGCSSYASRSLACSPSPVPVAVFYVSLYLVALAEAGHKPCAQAFGADQFDQNDPKESVSRSSFFNWWYFGMCSGTAVTTMVSSYIQDNVGWGLGFGIPCLVMVFALLMFLLGTRNYRYYTATESSPFARLARAFVALVKGSKSKEYDG